MTEEGRKYFEVGVNLSRARAFQTLQSAQAELDRLLSVAATSQEPESPLLPCGHLRINQILVTVHPVDTEPYEVPSCKACLTEGEEEWPPWDDEIPDGER